ncbi:MAG TPA: lysophospholipid acyltransferase family protein [Caulobacteraceae bacterium]|nr:lysophospholipid acyltransferase family protein [Caulobacteraceae bacterium]
MKRLIRSRAAQALLGLVLAAYLKPTLASIRWRHVGRDKAEGLWNRGGPAIACFWHSRIALSPACWPMDRVRAGTAQDPRALISLSADGAFIAAAMARLGFPAIRGSSTKTWDKAKAKGGAAAFREALRWLKGGGGVAITPDGPRGPAEHMAEGAPLLAKLSGAPVLLVGLACAPGLRLNTWDRAVLPRPFGRGVIIWAGPFWVAADADREAVEAARAEWEAALSRITAEAETLAA